MKTTDESTRYEKVAEDLRRQMRAGQLKPGDRLPSFAEMRAQGISQNTMEKVHALLEREHLIARRHRAGVFVADATIHKPRNGILGVSGKGFSFRGYSPYWVSLLRGIREAADQVDMQVLLLDHTSNSGWEKADGVLICDWSNRLTMQWLPPQMPCVSVLVPAESQLSVYADDFSGGRIATEYLLSLGHRKIAYLHSGGNSIHVGSNAPVGRRMAGWSSALKSSGITPRATWQKTMQGRLDYGQRYIERGRDTMRSWLESDWKKTDCTTILAHNDETAIGIIQALQEQRFRVPEDVSVVGFDGAAATEYSALQLTTIEIPLERIGHTAVQLLLHQLGGEDVQEPHRVFPVLLRKGETTALAN